MRSSDIGATAKTGACIVGGGPAGLLLGLLLARRGAEVIVLEGHDTFDREFRGEVLHPSTARLLDAVGLLPYILAQPHLTLTTGRLLVGARAAAQFAFDRIAPEYPYAIWMPQPIFLEALVRKGAPFAGFHCWMGARVTDLVEEEGVVTGVRGVRHGKEPFEVRADVVVGADGRHSVIRRLGHFPTAYEHHDFDVVWFVVDPPEDWPRTVCFSLGRTPCILLPKHPDRIQVGLLLHESEWRSWRQDGVKAVAGRLRRLLPLFEGFASSLRDFTPFVPLPGIMHLEREWAKDGVLLIGDAAHTMSPAGAIGVNVALATAAVAAETIFPRLGAGPIPKDALARVQRVREEDVRTLHRLQRGGARILLASASSNTLVRWLMPHALPLVARSRFFPRLQRRLFFGAPLPPLDPAFSFREDAS